ncbi:DUF2079 domain-containing protein [Maribellus comscasis]|uniref:DUF2079 domain-containing protein n=1 Tax=Maribellus comscasis TaxID=2681766 RepID=A0A6I6JQ27_9BACT|nr:DUF2079 domain-containing protein [Maribellus comscasis]QGY43249.1 DUF2079 domain-containing protein [Maribellus comscasis]
MKIRFRQKHIPYFILVFFGILLFTMGITNHYLFRTVTFDYGNYNFAFWDYSHFKISPIPYFRSNFLQDHFSFTLMYFVPVFWLLNWLTHSYTLIIIQNALILIAAWYTYKTIKLKTDNVWLGAGVLLYYFLLLGRYTSFSADVNLAIISSCFIPIFIYYFVTKKYVTALVIFILSLFSRENIPLWFIFIFIVLILENRKDKKAVKYCFSGIFISIIYFILLFKVFIPSIETKNVGYTLFNYSALGATPGEAILYILRHPVESIKLFFVNHLDDPAYNGVKAEFYLVYIISGGFVLLAKPKYLIWFIPIIAQKVLNDVPTRWGIATYYSVEVVTLLPLSVFLTLSSVKSHSFQKVLTILVCTATVSVTTHKLERSNNRIPYTLNPSKVKIYDKHFFEAPFNVKKVNRLLKQIPSQASVSASNTILPHLAQRQKIYFFPVIKDAGYIVFSVYDNNYLHSQMGNEKIRNNYLSSPDWKIAAKEFPVFLLKRDTTSSQRKESANIIFNKTDTLTCDFEKTDTISGYTLFSDGEKAEMAKYLTNEKSLSGNHSIKLSQENRYGTRIWLRNLSQYDYLEISLWGYSQEKNQVHIVAEYLKDFDFYSNESDTTNASGWQKYVLNFWIPKQTDRKDCAFFFRGSGESPVYIDDLKVVKKVLASNIP